MTTETLESTEREEYNGMLSPEALQYAPLEAKLREWQLPYSVDREFPVANVRVSSALQIRLNSNVAPSNRVEEYALQMRNGAIFPPIVLRIPGNNLIDGSTRWYAAKRIGRKTLPAILVDTRTEDVAVMLAAALNQMGGERLTASEAHNAALIMMRCGYPDPAVARELGRDLTQVRKWRNQNDVEKRAGELELFEEAKIIPRTTLGTLVGVRLEEPFKEMVKLFSAIKPTEKEAREMVSQVSQAVSETAALKVVQDIRDELAPGGPPPYIATREIPLARTAITNLLKFEGRPSAAFDPRKVADERNRWRRLLVVAGQVVKAMDAYGYEENDV